MKFLMLFNYFLKLVKKIYTLKMFYNKNDDLFFDHIHIKNYLSDSPKNKLDKIKSESF